MRNGADARDTVTIVSHLPWPFEAIAACGDWWHYGSAIRRSVSLRILFGKAIVVGSVTGGGVFVVEKGNRGVAWPSGGLRSRRGPGCTIKRWRGASGRKTTAFPGAGGPKRCSSKRCQTCEVGMNDQTEPGLSTECRLVPG